MRILIVDDDQVVSESFSMLLRHRAGKILQNPVDITCVPTLSRAIEAIKSLEQMRPNLVFLDLNLSAADQGLKTLTRYAAENYYSIPTVIFSGVRLGEHGTRTIIRACVAYPFVLTVLLKSAAVNEALVGLELILSGEFWTSREIMSELVAPGDPPPIDQSILTPREWEVADEMCRGHKCEVIAQNLNLSAEYVRKVCSGIYKKLGVHTKVGAILALQRRNINTI